MKKHFLVMIVLLSTICVYGQFSAREVSRTGNIPDLISFQGRLTDSGGNPVNDELTIVFSVYNSDLGGTPLWTENRPVDASEGLFQVHLGEVNPLDESYFSAETRWLGVKIGTDDEMTPRIRVTSAPYALNAVENDPTWSGATNTTDAIWRTGNVGIGTETPAAKLEVSGGDARIHGLIVGRGGGALLSNTAIGGFALIDNTTGDNNTAVGLGALSLNSIGSNNTALGYSALNNNETGYENTAAGYYALANNESGFHNTAAGSRALNNSVTADGNTAIGINALLYNNSGVNNIAIGSNTLANNNSGSHNIAAGYQALYWNFSGNNNTATSYRALYNNIYGSNNTAIGTEALFSNTESSENTAIGYQVLYSNTEGFYNTAAGYRALYNNTEGHSNTAVGTNTLTSNTWGIWNTAIGSDALKSNTSGNANTALGDRALFSNTTGSNNTATGREALQNNTSGSHNSALGKYALMANTTGSFNTSFGEYSLYSVATGAGNTAFGSGTLYNCEAGLLNTAIGQLSLYYNTAGNFNTAIGYKALWQNQNDRNTAIGHQAILGTSGLDNVAVGNGSANIINSNYNTTVGHEALYALHNQQSSLVTRIGGNQGGGYPLRLGSESTFVGNMWEVGTDTPYIHSAAYGYDACLIGVNHSVFFGHRSWETNIGGYANWTNLSDRSFKKNVQEDVKGLDFILKLRPVVYNLDNDYSQNHSHDNEATFNRRLSSLPSSNDKSSLRGDVISPPLFSGLIGKEAENAALECGFNFSGIVKPSEESDIWGLRYAEFVVPLVKAVQEQQQVIQDQQKQLEELMERIQLLQNRNGRR